MITMIACSNNRNYSFQTSPSLIYYLPHTSKPTALWRFKDNRIPWLTGINWRGWGRAPLFCNTKTQPDDTCTQTQCKYAAHQEALSSHFSCSRQEILAG